MCYDAESKLLGLPAAIAPSAMARRSCDVASPSNDVAVAFIHTALHCASRVIHSAE